MKALADDKKVIFRAASAAQAAVDFITERCGNAVQTETEEVAA